VYSSLTEAGTYTRLGITVPSLGHTYSYTAFDLTPRTTYYFKVSACNHLGESPQSEPVSATTEIPSYKVTFNTNGGTGAAPPSQKAFENTTITLPSGNGLSKPGFTFTGWYNSSLGIGTVYKAGDSYTVTSDAYMYAKWDTPYTVIFNANGGNGTPPTSLTEAAAGSGITLPSGSGLSRAGYTFGGWTTSYSGTGDTHQAGEIYKPTSDNTILYAKWNSINATALISGTWTDGRLSTANGEDWYSFTVSYGTTYYIWWNDSGDGNNTKTGDVVVSAQANGTFLFGGSDDMTEDDGWSTPKTISNQTGTVYIRVIPYQRKSTSTGTYGIVFSTSNTRPQP
jgi:uncharacterized repeat protein (TIGR02543 family)